LKAMPTTTGTTAVISWQGKQSSRGLPADS
jgi:hypothetical protein